MLRISAICFLLLLTNVSLADEADKFFEKDYAKNPLDQSKDAPVKEFSEEEIDPQENTETPTAHEDKKDFVSDSDIEPKSSDKPGSPLDWIGLIISTDNRSRLDSTVKKLSELVRKHDLKVGVVYFVGSSATAFEFKKFMAEFVARGSVIKFPARPPKEYAVKRSPSWIIALKEGQVLLDGVLDPSQYLNDKGEFIGQIETKE